MLTEAKPNMIIDVDAEVYTLANIQSALYSLNARYIGQISKGDNRVIQVSLSSIDNTPIPDRETEEVFYGALLAATAGELAFKQSAPIRELFARTALSITTPSQQLIQEFAANLAVLSKDSHLGAPDTGMFETPGTSVEGQYHVNSEDQTIRVVFPPAQHCLVDMMDAIFKLRNRATGTVQIGAFGRSILTLTAKTANVDLVELRDALVNHLART